MVILDIILIITNSIFIGIVIYDLIYRIKETKQKKSAAYTEKQVENIIEIVTIDSITIGMAKSVSVLLNKSEPYTHQELKEIAEENYLKSKNFYDKCK